MNPDGVRRPYVWVTVWILFLVIVGAAFWYFFLRSQLQTDDEIIERSTAGESNTRLTSEERSAITAHSSAVATSTPLLTNDIRSNILKQSSVAPAVNGKTTTTLTPAESEALLRSSSAR